MAIGYDDTNVNTDAHRGVIRLHSLCIKLVDYR